MRLPVATVDLDRTVQPITGLSNCDAIDLPIRRDGETLAQSIEVHREEYLATLKKMFAEHHHELRQVNQQPLPVLGREMRDAANWWLVSASVPMA